MIFLIGLSIVCADADLDLMLGCDDCKSVRSPAELAQCNNGHLLCQPCVDKIAKIILTSSEKVCVCVYVCVTIHMCV